MVLNVADRTKVMGGMLPISPGSQLAWVGFSETGILSSYDSKVSINYFSLEVHCDCCSHGKGCNKINVFHSVLCSIFLHLFLLIYDFPWCLCLFVSSLFISMKLASVSDKYA